MACEANDAIAAAKALLALGKAHWPQQPPGNLEALAVRWRQAAGELRNLDRQLYAADAPDWNGAALWELARGGLPAEQAFKRDANNDLDPLYPQSVQ
jgi:hypothetical protein